MVAIELIISIDPEYTMMRSILERVVVEFIVELLKV
jgi:hypothetical protein